MSEKQPEKEEFGKLTNLVSSSEAEEKRIEGNIEERGVERLEEDKRPRILRGRRYSAKLLKDNEKDNWVEELKNAGLLNQIKGCFFQESTERVYIAFEHQIESLSALNAYKEYFGDWKEWLPKPPKLLKHVNHNVSEHDKCYFKPLYDKLDGWDMKKNEKTDKSILKKKKKMPSAAKKSTKIEENLRRADKQEEEDKENRNSENCKVQTTMEVEEMEQIYLPDSGDETNAQKEKNFRNQKSRPFVQQPHLKEIQVKVGKVKEKEEIGTYKTARKSQQKRKENTEHYEEEEIEGKGRKRATGEEEKADQPDEEEKDGQILRVEKKSPRKERNHNKRESENNEEIGYVQKPNDSDKIFKEGQQNQKEKNQNNEEEQLKASVNKDIPKQKILTGEDKKLYQNDESIVVEKEKLPLANRTFKDGQDHQNNKAIEPIEEENQTFGLDHQNKEAAAKPIEEEKYEPTSEPIEEIPQSNSHDNEIEKQKDNGGTLEKDKERSEEIPQSNSHDNEIEKQKDNGGTLEKDKEGSEEEGERLFKGQRFPERELYEEMVYHKDELLLSKCMPQDPGFAVLARIFAQGTQVDDLLRKALQNQEWNLYAYLVENKPKILLLYNNVRFSLGISPLNNRIRESNDYPIGKRKDKPLNLKRDFSSQGESSDPNTSKFLFQQGKAPQRRPSGDLARSAYNEGDIDEEPYNITDLRSHVLLSVLGITDLQRSPRSGGPWQQPSSKAVAQIPGKTEIMNVPLKDWIHIRQVNLFLTEMEYNDERYQMLLSQIIWKNAAQNGTSPSLRVHAKYNICFLRCLIEDYGVQLAWEICKEQEYHREICKDQESEKERNVLLALFQEVYDSMRYDILHRDDKGIFHYKYGGRKVLDNAPPRFEQSAFLSKEQTEKLNEASDVFYFDYCFTNPGLPRYFFGADL